MTFDVLRLIMKFLTLFVDGLSLMLPGIFCRHFQKTLYVQQQAFCKGEPFEIDPKNELTV